MEKSVQIRPNWKVTPYQEEVINRLGGYNVGIKMVLDVCFGLVVDVDPLRVIVMTPECFVTKITATPLRAHPSIDDKVDAVCLTREATPSVKEWVIL